jgi:hypothetical protein
MLARGASHASRASINHRQERVSVEDKENNANLGNRRGSNSTSVVDKSIVLQPAMKSIEGENGSTTRRNGEVPSFFSNLKTIQTNYQQSLQSHSEQTGLRAATAMPPSVTMGKATPTTSTSTTVDKELNELRDEKILFMRTVHPSHL